MSEFGPTLAVLLLALMPEDCLGSDPNKAPGSTAGSHKAKANGGNLDESCLGIPRKTYFYQFF